MDKTALVGPAVDAGAQLVRALDDAVLPLPAALWFYMPDEDEWRLMLASPLVESDGAQAVYGRVQEVLGASPASPLSLANISVVSPQDELIRLLSLLPRAGRDISGVRLTRSAINGVLIEDAYIYRLAR